MALLPLPVGPVALAMPAIRSLTGHFAAMGRAYKINNNPLFYI
jgi:hypothetical protein